ncbi:MAG: hypothetical protein JO258_16515 [Alphaproteobacteria bacterium]|nr:hypothetical protein [Alphaproteobacteria bacterium]
MRKAILMVAAASLPLSACATYNSDHTLASAGTGAAIGAAGGAGVAALAGGSLLAGAAIGAAVGGLAGAVWADRNNDGVADGYVYNGTYYEGAPAGYNGSTTYVTPVATAPTCRSVGRSAAVGAVGGAALGAGVSAVAGTGLLASAVVGAAVGGLAGAVWADSNNDGCVDGYVREGRYYAGEPVLPPARSVAYTGERG